MGTKTTILGGGAMATACAILLAEHPDQEVSMWVRHPDYAEELNRTRENSRLLAGVQIPPQVQISSSIEAAVAGSEFLVVAIPSKYLRSTLEPLAAALTLNRPVISVVKGIEVDTLLRPSQIINEVLGGRAIVALSGPSHAEEIARRLPASVVAASGDIALAKRVQQLFTTDRFRIYTNADLIGVELAGALKNVIAIAAGICDGLGYGDNAKSALMTRGIVEISRFGEALGAEAGTFAGLAGIGDLITTCTSRHGRNRLVGERLGRGEKLDAIIGSMDSVAEGVNTSHAVLELASQKGLDMPITAEVCAVLNGTRSPEAATHALMQRPLREE